MDKLTPDELALYAAEYTLWLDAHEPPPLAPTTLPLSSDPGDLMTVRRYRAEIARLLAAGRRMAG